MKTVGQALIDEVHYPLPDGFVENRLIARGLDSGNDFSEETARSDAFRGAVADCLVSLIHAPNFTEASKSISLADKALILRLANSIYESLGEDTVETEDTPMVFIGG